MKASSLTRLSLLGAAAALALAATPKSVGAQPGPPPPPCDGWQVDYALSGSLQLADTPLGQGDGIYAVGPGSMAVRFDDVEGKPGGRATVLSYEMHETFKVVAKTLFWATSVTTNTTTRATPASCDAPEGALTGAALVWSLPAPGVRSDGTLFCDGSFCGKFGAPPPGQSEVHLPPHPVMFKPFQFNADRTTFTMASTLVSKTDTPKQTSYLALAGRELRRACAQPKPCP